MAVIRALAQRARRLGLLAAPSRTAPARRAAAPASGSPHRFADIGVADATERTPDEVERIVERGPLPVRFGIARAEPVGNAPDDAGAVRDADALLAWPLAPPLDLVEVRRANGDPRVTAVKVLDLALEPYRSAAGIERELAPLVDRLGALLRFRPAKHTLHLELSGEPTKDQREGLARLRDYALKRARETAIDLELHVAAPGGRAELRPSKP